MIVNNTQTTLKTIIEKQKIKNTTIKNNKTNAKINQIQPTASTAATTTMITARKPQMRIRRL